MATLLKAEEIDVEVLLVLSAEELEDCGVRGAKEVLAPPIPHDQRDERQGRETSAPVGFLPSGGDGTGRTTTSAATATST